MRRRFFYEWTVSVIPKIQRKTFTIISAMLVFCAVFVTVITFYVIAISHWHGPFRDMWEIYPFLQKVISGSWSVNDLWECYGYSHRLFFPRLLFIADHQFFDATNHLLIAVSIGCQVLICVLFSLLLWRDNSVPVVQKYALVSILVCLQFSGTLLFNFMHTFDVQWFVCCFCIVAAFYYLSNLVAYNTELTDQSRIRYFVFSGLLIIAACLSNFSGMAAWPIWLLLIFTDLKNLKIKIILITLMALFIAIYLSGVRSAHISQAGVLDLLTVFFYIFVAFPFAYLANPLADSDFLPFGYGAALIVAPALYVLVKFWWDFLVKINTRKKSRLAFFLACIGLFGFGVAVITAIGRGYDPSHVRALRYQNVVMLFWSALILLVTLQSRDYVTHTRYLLRLPFIATFVGFMWCQHISWNQNIWLGYQVNRAHLALMMGHSNNVPMIAPTVSRSMIYVPDYNLEPERALYQEARKGIYHGKLADDWLYGVSIPFILQSCPALSWSLSPYTGTYSKYTSFSVSGETAGFNQAFLINAAGSVLAIAITEGSSNLISSLRRSIGLHSPNLKGFSATSDKPVALVMRGPFRKSVICAILPADYSHSEN